MYIAWGKRCFDLVVAVTLLIALSPVWIAVAAVVFLVNGAPVLFRQERAGRGGSSFLVLKFKTMTDGRATHGALLPDEQRTTRTGRFLRQFSLDELPQLWNIVKGDMSLVGPRPLLPQYVERYSKQQRRRLDVLPGLTGWAQINGRNTLEWDARFELDAHYVEHLTFRFDLYILARTVGQVLSGRNVEPVGTGAMEEFQGSRPKGQPQTDDS